MDVAVFEDLAVFLSFLSPFMSKDPHGQNPKAAVLELLGASGENIASQLSALHALGRAVLSGAEERCVPAKLTQILPLIYADNEFWDGMSKAESEANKEFVLEGKATQPRVREGACAIAPLRAYASVTRVLRCSCSSCKVSRLERDV